VRNAKRHPGGGYLLPKSYYSPLQLLLLRQQLREEDEVKILTQRRGVALANKEAIFRLQWYVKPASSNEFGGKVGI
jgi:hypothetical protein